MFSTTTGIKQNFYSQTGDFQFGVNLIIPSLFGGVNVGISGANPTGNKINYFCNSGKIWDNSGRFMGVYRANESFSLSGNVTAQKYDYFVNGSPEAYNYGKSTGTFNYLYLQNPGGLNCQYDFFVNGEQPSLTINPVNCFSGDYAGTGYVINSKSQFPLRIYSGVFTNLSDNLPFQISGFFTGDLTNSGKFYVIPGVNAVGFYTGNLQIITNGGTLSFATTINITGTPAANNFGFNLIDQNDKIITANNSKNYVSNIFCTSGAGIPILVSLDYVSGSGNFYKNIDVLTGVTGKIVSGSITGSATLSGYFLGTGTGQGGKLNNTGSGAASASLSNLFYSTGLFSWPISLIVTGFGSGINYTGLASGSFNGNITGRILANSGSYFFDGNFTGNKNPIYSISGTGEDLGTGTQLVTMGAITGGLTQVFTGSGFYSELVSGFLTGSGVVIDYQKTFLSSWDLLTGAGILQVDYSGAGFYNAGQNKYFNNYPKNYIDSAAFIQVNYVNNFDTIRDVVRLTISGQNTISGIQIFITGSGVS